MCAARSSFSPAFPEGLRLTHAVSQKPGILEGLFQMLRNMVSGALLLAPWEREGFPSEMLWALACHSDYVTWSLL